MANFVRDIRQRTKIAGSRILATGSWSIRRYLTRYLLKSPRMNNGKMKTDLRGPTVEPDVEVGELEALVKRQRQVGGAPLLGCLE